MLAAILSEMKDSRSTIKEVRESFSSLEHKHSSNCQYLKDYVLTETTRLETEFLARTGTDIQ